MTIGDNIQQKTFSNERGKALVNILYTHNHLINKLNQLLKVHSITRQQYNVLRILRGQYPDPTNINLIKERMLDKMSDASRIVERLKSKELIIKKAKATDKRESCIIINKRGLELLETLDPLLQNFEAQNIKLNSEEAHTFNNLIDKLRGN